MKQLQKDFFGNQIAITSLTGAGSSTQLALFKSYIKGPYRFISGGDMMREESHRRAMSIETFAQYNREHPEEGIDKMLDQKNNTLGTHDYVIAEGRLVHIFFPGAFKVYLHCDLDIRALRRAKQIGNSDVSAVKREVQNRDNDDNERYRQLYGSGCLWTPEQYHCVVNSGELSSQDVFEVVLCAHLHWLDKAKSPDAEYAIVQDSSCWPAFAVNAQTLFIEAIP